MADFCKQCSLEIFGEDYGELAGLQSIDDANNSLYPVVMCEGCGVIQVTADGTCISDCLRHHRRLIEELPPDNSGNDARIPEAP